MFSTQKLVPYNNEWDVFYNDRHIFPFLKQLSQHQALSYICIPKEDRGNIAAFCISIHASIPQRRMAYSNYLHYMSSAPPTADPVVHTLEKNSDTYLTYTIIPQYFTTNRVKEALCNNSLNFNKIVSSSVQSNAQPYYIGKIHTEIEKHQLIKTLQTLQYLSKPVIELIGNLYKIYESSQRTPIILYSIDLSFRFLYFKDIVKDTFVNKNLSIMTLKEQLHLPPDYKSGTTHVHFHYTPIINNFKNKMLFEKALKKLSEVNKHPLLTAIGMSDCHNFYRSYELIRYNKTKKRRPFVFKVTPENFVSFSHPGDKYGAPDSKGLFSLKFIFKIEDADKPSLNELIRKRFRNLITEHGLPGFHRLHPADDFTTLSSTHPMIPHIISGNTHEISKLLTTRNSDHHKKLITTNSCMGYRDPPAMLLAIIYDQHKVIELFFELGFSIEKYPSCELNVEDMKFYNYNVTNRWHSDSKYGNLFSIEDSYKTKKFNYLDNARSFKVWKILLRHSAPAKHFRPRIIELIKNNNFEVIYSLFRYNFTQWIKSNYFDKSLLDISVQKAADLVKTYKNPDLRILRLVLKTAGFLPEGMYDINLITRPVAKLLFEHNQDLARNLYPKLMRPKIHSIELINAGRELVTTLVQENGNQLTSKIMSTADLYDLSMFNELKQTYELYNNNFAPIDNTPTGRSKHFQSKISRHKSDNKFVELIMDGNTVASYFSFQILEYQHPQFGSSILFFGLSAAVKKGYGRLGLATLVLRIPIAIDKLFPDTQVFVLNEFLPDSFSFATLPIFTILFPRYDMNKALIKHLTSKTNKKMLPNGTMLAGARVIRKSKPNRNSLAYREHYEITQGNKSLAVAAIYTVNATNTAELMKEQLCYHNYGKHETHQTANAFCFFYYAHKKTVTDFSANRLRARL